MTHKDFLYKTILALVAKAHYYESYNPVRGGATAATKRKREKEAEEAAKRKRISVPTNNKKLRVSDFPQRLNHTLTHILVSPTKIHLKAPKRGACVLCSTKYDRKKAQQMSRCRDNDGVINERLKWREEVNRSQKACLGCLADNTICFLCDTCNKDFHTAPKTLYQ